MFLSRNYKIPLEFILINKDKSWHWSNISNRKDLKMKHIIDNPDVYWCWDTLSKNNNLKIDFVINNLDESWDWRCVLNHDFTIDKKEFFL